MGIGTKSGIMAAAGAGIVYTNTRSLLFDGINDYVDCGDNNNLSFGDGSSDSPFSISAWVKPDNAAKFRLLFKQGSTLKEYFFQIANGKKLQMSLNNNSGQTIGRNGASDISTTSWSHVAMTYNGSSDPNGINIYRNGSLNNGGTFANGGTYTAMTNTSQPIELGKFSTTFADGRMDEVAIFNSALSATDMSDIYNSGLPADLSGYSSLVSWWRFEEGSGTTATDSGTGGNNGTINGAIYSVNVPS